MRNLAIVAVAALAFPAPSFAMDATGLAFAAICAEQYGEHDVFDAAFSLYEAENPDNLTADQLAKTREKILDTVDTSEIEDNPVAAQMTRGICDKARAALLG